MHRHVDMPHRAGELALHFAASRYYGNVMPARGKLVRKVDDVPLDAAYIKFGENFDDVHFYVRQFFDTKYAAQSKHVL